VGNSRIASVDLSGLVTALKGGTTTVTVTTADGSRKSDTATVRVVVPVTGVTYPYTDIRVGQEHYGHFTVRLHPSDATIPDMTWVTADPDIATVTGDTNTFKIVGGKNFGRTTVTGTTADGGYAITLNVNIGSLYRAVTVRKLEIRSGKPYITLQNNSDMVITQVRYYLKGLDPAYLPIEMSTTGDTRILYGTYDLPLYPGGQTEHGMFNFFAPSNYPNLTYLELVITGWSTSSGYYNTDGALRYEYTIEENRQQPAVYPAGTDPGLFIYP
ncbi:MAG: Ig-like domain-containing protein, partial [Bacillota bacterium]